MHYVPCRYPPRASTANPLAQPLPRLQQPLPHRPRTMAKAHAHRRSVGRPPLRLLRPMRRFHHDARTRAPSALPRRASSPSRRPCPSARQQRLAPVPHRAAIRAQVSRQPSQAEHARACKPTLRAPPHAPPPRSPPPRSPPAHCAERHRTHSRYWSCPSFSSRSRLSARPTRNCGVCRSCPRSRSPVQS